MENRLTRRTLLCSAPLAGAFAQQTAAPIPERPPALAGPLVKEFVIAGHGNLDKTKAMLAENPKLLNATWDWGAGDFETALGGASHMGNREIAAFLLDQGARMDLFTAAMLGRLDIVQAAVSAFPNIHRSLGPHGITMVRHAEKGGEHAEAVVKYLRSLA
jgi:hypothetical protein